MKKITLWVILLSCGIFGVLGCSQGLVHTDRTDLSNKIVYVLPKGYIKVVNNGTTITVDTVYEPDENHYYLLKYTPNIGFDDDITMAVDAKGFLSSIQVTTTSKVPDIIKKMEEIAISALEIALAVKAGEPFEVIIDPEEIPEYGQPKPEKTYSWEKYIKKDSISLQHPTAITFLYEKASKSASEQPPEGNHFIYYRPALPFKLRLQVAGTYIERVVYLPNYSKIGTFDVTRPAFVKKVQNLTFTNGLLTQVALKKDSELLAALGIPADVVKTVAGLPLTLMNFQTGNLQGETSLLQTQMALLQAQIDWQNKKNQSQTDRQIQGLMNGQSRIEEEIQKLRESIPPPPKKKNIP